MKLKVLGATALSLSLLLCAVAPVYAQDAPSSFLNWLRRIGRSGAHHRPAPLPPLPKARPAKLGPAAVTPNKPAADTSNKPAADTSSKPAADMSSKPAAVTPSKPAADTPNKPPDVTPNKTSAAIPD